MDKLAILKAVRVGALLSLLAVAVGATALGPSRAVAASSAPTRVAADLISETMSIQPGTTLWVALRLQPPAGWYTYWSNRRFRLATSIGGLSRRVWWPVP